MTTPVKPAIAEASKDMPLSKARGSSSGGMKKNAFDQAKADACQIVKPAFELSEADLKTEVVEVVKAAKKLVDLIGADYILSVGRGISKDVEGGIKLAEELAEVLGGVVCHFVFLSI